jgi:hypothetical protein
MLGALFFARDTLHIALAAARSFASAAALRHVSSSYVFVRILASGFCLHIHMVAFENVMIAPKSQIPRLTVQQCEAKVSECRAMALAAPKPEDRVMLEQMAEIWTRLRDEIAARAEPSSQAG